MDKLASPFLTIAEYWQSHGFSKEEAKCMEREQIKEALEREAFYDSMDADPF
jgi:hypothetical protein